MTPQEDQYERKNTIKKKKDEEIKDIDKVVDELVSTISEEEEIAEEELFDWVEKEHKRLGIFHEGVTEKSEGTVQEKVNDIEKFTEIEKAPDLDQDHQEQIEQEILNTASEIDRVVTTQAEVSEAKKISLTTQKEIKSGVKKPLKKAAVTSRPDLRHLKLQRELLLILDKKMRFFKDFERIYRRKGKVKMREIEVALNVLQNKRYIVSGQWDSRGSRFITLLPYLKEDYLFKITKKGKKSLKK